MERREAKSEGNEELEKTKQKNNKQTAEARVLMRKIGKIFGKLSHCRVAAFCACFGVQRTKNSLKKNKKKNAGQVVVGWDETAARTVVRTSSSCGFSSLGKSNTRAGGYATATMHVFNHNTFVHLKERKKKSSQARKQEKKGGGREKGARQRDG